MTKPSRIADQTLQAEHIVRVLGGTWHGTSGMARCPAHHDSNPSLSVRSADGKVLLHCHAGCRQEAVVEALKSRGLWQDKVASRTLPTRDHAYDERQPYRRGMAILRAAVEHDEGPPTAYLSSRGLDPVPSNAMTLPASQMRRLCGFGYPAMVLPIIGKDGLQGAHVTFLKRKSVGNVRKNGKSFRRIYGTAKGGYVQLSEPHPDRPLIVAEGVETALSASQITGLPAIAALSATNFSSVHIPPYSELIIARDRGKAGRTAAEALARRLSSSQRKVRIARPPRGYGDWNDALNSKIGHKKLRQMLVKAPAVKAEVDDALTMGEFMGLDIPPLTCLVNPILVMPGMTMLHARAGHGKTRLALSLAYAYATGEPLMDWEIDEPGRVLYIDAELSLENMGAWLDRLGPPTANLKILSDKLNYHRRRPKVSLETEEDRQYLMGQIEQHDAKLVILDALFTLVPPDIIAGKVTEDQWPPIMEFLRDLKRDNRHAILLHHDNKGGSQYGQSIKEIGFDLMMQLKERHDHNVEGKWAFELSFTKPRHLSAMQAVSRIITATDTGAIEWERTDKSLDRRRAGAQKHREQVVTLTAKGYSTSEIANEIGISQRRVQLIKVELKDDES